MRGSLFCRCVVVAITLIGRIVYAEGYVTTSPGIEVVTQAEKRVVTSTPEGPSVEFVRADQLRIGDEICYTLRVRNTTNAPIEAPVIVKSLPRNTEYVIDSAVGPAASVALSFDGGSTFVDAEQGGPIRSLSHIRWQLRHPLAPGAIALLRFRGIFE